MNHQMHVTPLAGGGKKWSRFDSLTIGKNKAKRLRRKTAKATIKPPKKKAKKGGIFSIINKALSK